MFEAWARAHGGARDEGLEQFQQALAGYRRTGAGLMVPHHLAMLAEIHLLRNEAEPAAELIHEGLALAETQHAQLYVPELLRLDATVAARRDSRESESKLRASVEAARAMDARLLQLRAAAELRRLLQQQGRRTRPTRSAQNKRSWRGGDRGHCWPDARPGSLTARSDRRTD